MKFTTARCRRSLGMRCAYLACALVIVTCWNSRSTAEPQFSVPAGQRQLFLDDHGVHKLTNLTRTMHQPRKRGAVIRAPRENQTLQIRTAPAWDPELGRYRIWLHGLDRNIWESRDGVNWTVGPEPKPSIVMAVYDPNDDDPQCRYKAAHLNSGFSVSADGVKWTRLAVPAIQSFDEGNFSYDPQHGLFIHTVKRRGPHGRSVAIATSRDFRTWKDYGVVFHADTRDQELGRQRIEARRTNPALKQTEYHTPEHYSVQIYNMGVFHYEGLYIGLPSMYHHTGKVPPDWPGFDKMHLSPYILGLVRKHGDYTGFYTIELAYSRDLVNWQRLGSREPFIEASPLGAGAYDTQTLIGPSEPVVRDDELWFYYTGIQQYAFIGSGNDPAYDDYVPDAGAICLAVLRRDGFMSLDAGDDGGEVITKPFVLSGGDLSVNVAIGKNGRLDTTVLDDTGSVVAGAEPLTRGQRRGTLNWQSGSLTALRDKTVSLRFTLRNASLYSYWVGPARSE